MNIYLTNLNFSPPKKNLVTSSFCVLFFGFRRPFFRFIRSGFFQWAGGFFFQPTTAGSVTQTGRDPGDVFVHKSALESVPSHLECVD